MKKIFLIFMGVLVTQTACDLKPKITSLPDSVGDFISARYPALLADPNVNPEIYNSAASDYGVYASPELYGSDAGDDYVLYASVNDYVMPVYDENNLESDDKESDESDATDGYIHVPMYGGVTKDKDVVDTGKYVVVESGDTLYKIARDNNISVDELAKINGLESSYTLRIGQKLKVVNTKEMPTDVVEDVLKISKPVSGVHAVTRVELQDVTVRAGDTLYSLSRQYSVPVNDLAVMNDLKAPFALSVGQKLRVPNLGRVQKVQVVKSDVKKSADVEKVQKSSVYSDFEKNEYVQKKSTDVKQNVVAEASAVAQPVKKISSDPTKKLPKISARSSSKFSWPVRGKILSNYGAKSNGLFNDGINISVKRGSAVKAAENGVVAYAGNEVKGMGNLIIVQHSGGWMTVYAHLDSMTVRRGNRVTVGQKIGAVGETGKVDSPQLHFEIRKGTKAYNPMSYLKN